MIGKTLSHYTILEQLGAGGMGVVFRARDARLGRDVALKLLPADSLGSEPARHALENEARAASALNHPNICAIHDVGEADGQFFIAMEYVEGSSLAQMIPSGGLPQEQVLHYGMQIADALAHGEQRGIVHRDLKSANVVVTPEGRAKVLDFGLAQRVRKDEVEEATRSKMSLESSGGIAGTLMYMAPELLRGEPADARSDIWALGVVLYEMAVGALPFRGATGFDLSAAILREPLPPLPPRVSPALRVVIERCLAKDPAQRYQHAGEVRAALEATESGTRTSAVVAPESQPHTATFWRSATIAGAAVLALAALLLAFNVGGTRDRLLGRVGAPPKIESIAVLPLANMSGDPSQEYFADGMTEALIAELSKIRVLKVISRTSVMEYKGAKKPLPQIARDLKVDALLEGSVARFGDHVRIAVALYEGASDRELWSGTFERDLNDVLALEDQVAHAVAVQLRLKISSSGGTTASTNPEAYDLYFKGRYSLDQGSEAELKLALVYFRQAIEKDPQYAPLYAGLADAYARLPFYTDTRPSEAFPKAKEAAANALRLEPTLAEAHASTAYILNYYDWDRSGAEREFKQALELNPSDAAAHHAYGRFLASMARIDEARAELNRAQELDPLSLGIQSNVGMVSYFARQYDDALQQLRKVLAIDPKFPVPYWGIGMCYEQLKKYPEALVEFQKGIELSGRGANGLASLAHAHGLAGQGAEAQKILAELTDRSKTKYVSPYQFAVIYLGLGQNERAIGALEDAYRERSTLLGYLKMDPRFDPLRSDPRFQALLRRMKLPQ